jgi:hypothetical protein
MSVKVLDFILLCPQELSPLRLLFLQSVLSHTAPLGAGTAGGSGQAPTCLGGVALDRAQDPA